MSQYVTNWFTKNIAHYSGTDHFFLPMILNHDITLMSKPESGIYYLMFDFLLWNVLDLLYDVLIDIICVMSDVWGFISLV